MKYYAIFAVNKNDPKDILGYIEHSFNMGWSKSEVRVFNSRYRSSFIRKSSQDLWNDLRGHYAGCLNDSKIDHNVYKIVQCRVNSKFCPALVDTKFREGCDKKVIKNFHSYEYRNANFKAL